jgi:nicotinate-nucleotide--dimethylbenzimidazole phosphoribosyltransferase
VVEQALEVNNPRREDAVDILTKVGGYEIGGLMGWILAACSHGVPVVIDGFISTAAALLAVTLAPRVKDYLIAGHRSQEKGHSLALDFLELNPVVDLEMRLGEGTGAALAIGIVEAALKLFHEVASFKDAKVTDPQPPKVRGLTQVK